MVGAGDAAGVSPPWQSGADFEVDPLVGVHVPSFPSLSHPEILGQPGKQYGPVLWANSKSYPFPDPSVGLPPGVIWGGISVGNKDDLVLQGGTYIMAGGGFNVDGGTVSANAPVTIIYTNDPWCNSANSTSCTTPGLKSNGDLPLSTGQSTGASGGSWGLAPSTGTGPLTAPTNNTVDPYLDGILIYVDRNILPCTGGGNTTLTVGGGGSFYFDTGSIIYAPCSTVKLYGNGASQGGAVVAYQVSLNGSGKSLDLGGPGVPSGSPSKSNLVQ